MDLLGVEIVGAIGGRPERREINQSGVSIDSRAVGPDEIFFALEGERTDRHKYVAQALESGAACAVVHKDVDVPEALRDRLIRVEDTLRALADSARAYRRRWGGIVVAVTGSNGKTTTREMIHHILSGAMPCKRSPASFNTNIGVPLTLFLAERDDMTGALRHWKQGARLALLALLLMAVLSGAGLGLAALGDGQRPVNVFWALGSLLGLAIGSGIIGGIQSGVAAIVDQTAGYSSVLIIAILFLWLKPRGLVSRP